MAIRKRLNGTLICAAMSEPEPGDSYIDDGLHYQLSVVSRAIVADVEHEENGLWHWVHPNEGLGIRGKPEREVLDKKRKERRCVMTNEELKGQVLDAIEKQKKELMEKYGIKMGPMTTHNSRCRDFEGMEDKGQIGNMVWSFFVGQGKKPSDMSAQTIKEAEYLVTMGVSIVMDATQKNDVSGLEKVFEEAESIADEYLKSQGK